MPIEKRWVIKPQGDPQKVDELATATGIPTGSSPWNWPISPANSKSIGRFSGVHYASSAKSR